MKFVFPSQEYKEKAKDYINEFYIYQSEINGSGGLDAYLEKYSYENWLDKIAADLDTANVALGRVPSYTYFYVREEDESIVGMINIRLSLNEFLEREGGHIGYSIRPSERGKDYATNMLSEALDFCRLFGLDTIIVTCDKSNLASAKVIQKCGGQLEEEFYSDFFKTDIQRYIINYELEVE